MAAADNIGASGITPGQTALRAAQVLVVSSVMFTFISYWRTAAVVLCDLASTAYFIGGIVEQAIGPAAPWFIVAVMVFSYAVRSVYIESCTLFVRGGVYRVVREALGRFWAKIAVSALMFDYILTGPIGGVAAGQYVIGLALNTLAIVDPHFQMSASAASGVQRWGSVVIAVGITLYFFRQNVLGIRESSDKAVKIMIATTVMAVIMFSWCGLTLLLRPASQLNDVPITPELTKKVDYVDGVQVPKIDQATGQQQDPLGFLPYLLPSSVVEHLRQPVSWLSLIGVIGLFIAFGHSILAMSGEETLAQVYREIESPKLHNFRKAAFIIFIFSLLFTGGISFLAVMIIPNDVRMTVYSDNLISGLALNVVGPMWAKLFLSAFVTLVGFLILSGSVNTALIGANGVLSRVAEDGVLDEGFLKPHPLYGTSYRILYLVTGLQLFTILISRGHMVLLGEAYAFGVVWSFVFQAMAMTVLRFKNPKPRDYRVPLNLRLGSVEIPFGLITVLMILLITATLNYFTKEVAAIGGTLFTILFFILFTISERRNQRKLQGRPVEHLEEFHRDLVESVSPDQLRLTRPYRRLVALRSTQTLYILEKILAENDPVTTDVIVLTAKRIGSDSVTKEGFNLDRFDRHLLTNIVHCAEKAGQEVHPLIVPTNNPFYAIARAAKDLQVQEIVLGESSHYTPSERLHPLNQYWNNLHLGQPAPLSIRVVGRNHDMRFDIAGGRHVPTVIDRLAHSVQELRQAGVGVRRVLLVHEGTAASSGLFRGVLTMLDAHVELSIACLPSGEVDGALSPEVAQDQREAERLGRMLTIHRLSPDQFTTQLAQLASDGNYDLLIAPIQPSAWPIVSTSLDVAYLFQHAPCPVLLAAPRARQGGREVSNAL
ncbi:MAG: APC family permease [Gemmataceae bacterium]